LKCHYLAAFTAAMLNNQPMGFYRPATLIKDAQRHGLKFKPIDVTQSQWDCTVEEHAGELRVRIGLRYVKGLRKETAMHIVEQRTKHPFASIDDVKQRIPQMQINELRVLASIGAFNFIFGKTATHRRDALWQVERANRRPGPLMEPFIQLETAGTEQTSPLNPMTSKERIFADFRGTGLTVGPHPLAHHRVELNALGVSPAGSLKHLSDGKQVKVIGAVIVRQRPGTAKGFVFLSLEDETGVANIIIAPQLFERDHTVVVHHAFLQIKGVVQNQDGVISVKAAQIEPFELATAEVPSHDFH
jgi:error-prone DNA polymerase